MDDERILDLYWARIEDAITETANKYGGYCYQIAYNILNSREDSYECVNDTYLNAWNAIPPHRPSRLSAFLGKITRNLSINRYKRYAAKKRGRGQLPLALEELQECVPALPSVEQAADDALLAQALERFLTGLTAEARVIFMRRYWYFCSVKEIAAGLDLGESKVKMSLLRSRDKLRQFLEGEGIAL